MQKKKKKKRDFPPSHPIVTRRPETKGTSEGRINRRSEELRGEKKQQSKH